MCSATWDKSTILGSWVSILGVFVGLADIHSLPFNDRLQPATERLVLTNKMRSVAPVVLFSLVPESCQLLWL